MKLNVGHSLDHPYAITVHKEFIYWTDVSDQSILRAKKSNPSVVDVMREKISSLRDIHVVAADRQTGNFSEVERFPGRGVILGIPDDFEEVMPFLVAATCSSIPN